MRIVGALIALLIAFGLAGSAYVVGEGHAAMLLQFGRIERSGIGPGLHFKWPLLQQASLYDTRTLALEAEPDRYLTADGVAVEVGFYVRWRIADPDAYYRVTSGEELQATQQLAPLIRNALRSVVQTQSLTDLVAGANAGIDARLHKLVGGEAATRLGIAVLDVGIERIELPDDAADAVYKRMRAEAGNSAAAIRAAAQTSAATIRADGERARQKILAQAQQAAEKIRGEGDAQAAQIAAATAAPDPGFFAWWRGLQAYRGAFGDGHAVFVLDPDSPFLKPLGGANAANGKGH